jgi:hypothetical protein
VMEPVYDAEEVNQALRIIKSIKEVPNPEYKRAKRNSKAFSPQPGSIPKTSNIPAANLKEIIEQRERRHTVRLLNIVCDICQCCPDCSDCAWSCEIKAIDFCERIKRNLVYMGVIE